MPYFRIAGFTLLVVGICHLIGHIWLMPHFHLTSGSGVLPANGTERQILELVNGYTREVGGSEMSMIGLISGLSLIYALFFFWAGGVTLWVYKPVRRNHRLLARISFINAGAMLLGMLVAFVHFFWLPIASFALPFVLFLLAGMQFARSRQF